MQKNVTYNAGTYKIAFLASLFLIGAIAIFRWFVVPHQNYLEAAQKYESAISTLAGKKQIISNNLKTKRIKHQKLQEQFTDIQAKLFYPLGEREFFSNIEGICRQAGCKMISLTFSQSPAAVSKPVRQSPENDYISASAAHLAIEGRYGNIVALLNKLQDGSKLVKINPLSINADIKNPGYLNCDMTITIYVTNEKKDLRYDQDKQENL